MGRRMVVRPSLLVLIPFLILGTESCVSFTNPPRVQALCLCVYLGDCTYLQAFSRGEHYLGKREPEPAGRHTEGVWSPGRRKRSTQPGWMRKGGIPWTYNIKNLLAPSTRWTPRPTSALHFTSLMDPIDPSINKKRTELGPWGRLNKRNTDQS